MERTFGLRGTSRVDLFRQGFGLGPSRNRSLEEDDATRLTRAEEGAERHEDDEHALETDMMIPADDPHRGRLIAQAVEHDRRLRADLRDAGLL